MVDKRISRTLTEGVIWKEILLFAIPIMVGNLFQQLYNTVDSIIVGRFVGDQALAAVGASNPLINMIIGFFMGTATGAGIIIARYYGAKKYEEVHQSVHTFVAFSLILGFALTVLGYLFSPLLLRLLNTPAEVMVDAVVYLRVYFLGALSVTMYNTGAGILRAVGDSRHPLYYLCISSVIHIVLDIVFVVGFGLGVLGVSLATMIANLLSAILVFAHLNRSRDVYSVRFKKIKIHKEMLYGIITVGIPTGIQQMVVSFSNVLVQSYINGFGSSAIAGISAANKFASFMGLTIDSFSLTITTFTGQNLGARKKERVNSGIKVTLVLMLLFIIMTGVPSILFADSFIGLFSQDATVIQYGVGMLRMYAVFYFTLGIVQVLSGAIRGSGLSKIPMIISISTFCILRQIILFFGMLIWGSVEVIYWSYSSTWIAAMVLIIIYYRKSNWLKLA